MRLIVLAVGTRMPQWVETGWQEYAQRLPADCSLELKEIKPEPRNSGKTTAQLMQAEATRLEAALPPRVLRIALDEHGKDLTTMQLSAQLTGWREQGCDVALIIGGPDGLDEQFKRRCNGLIRLSSLTLPHPMVRVLLAEQLYRAWAIMVNHPYHRS